jgi:plastocyanin
LARRRRDTAITEGHIVNKRHLAALLVPLLALPLSACSGSSKASDAAAGSGVTVHLKLLQFTPSTLTVPPGTKVRFVNDEVITHTVTTGSYVLGDNSFRSSEKPDGKLNTKLDGKGDSTSYTFAVPGTYTYFCSIHKAMQGQIVVR